jgi:hypothetical protein
VKIGQIWVFFAEYTGFFMLLLPTILGSVWSVKTCFQALSEIGCATFLLNRQQEFQRHCLLGLIKKHARRNCRQRDPLLLG